MCQSREEGEWFEVGVGLRRVCDVTLAVFVYGCSDERR